MPSSRSVRSSVSVKMPDCAESAPELLALLRSLAGRWARVGVRAIRAEDEHGLHTDEREIIASAGDQRRAEFATGRALLRSLLGTDDQIGQLANRAPRLPDAWVGSLAHDRSFAIAMIAPAIELRAVGVDLEPVGAVDELTGRQVLRDDDEMPDATAAFVAKEAAYKAWSSLGAPILEHHDVHVRMTDSSEFEATVVAGGLPRLSGRVGRAADRVVAVVTVEAASASGVS